MRFFDFGNRFPLLATIYANNIFEAANIYNEQICKERKEILPLPEEKDIDEVYVLLLNSDIGAGDPDETWDEYLLNIIKSDKPRIVLIEQDVCREAVGE